MVKLSSVFFVVIFAAVFVAQYDCFQPRDVSDEDKLTFPSDENEPHFKANPQPQPVEEQGSLSVGRRIIKKVSAGYNYIKRGIKRVFSRETKGLDCDKSLSDGKQETFKSKIQAIFPGTKWCGDGNISESFEDLGKFNLTDKCCRDHDMCPDNMAADTTKYGLINTGLFTRSHCDCDQRFYQCLKEADCIIANSIGYTYFTVLGPQCFKKDYPVVECAKERRGKCENYVTDDKEDPIYQWFDSPVF